MLLHEEENMKRNNQHQKDTINSQLNRIIADLQKKETLKSKYELVGVKQELFLQF